MAKSLDLYNLPKLLLRLQPRLPSDCLENLESDLMDDDDDDDEGCVEKGCWEN